MTQDDDLDRELRRLFGDDRLDLSPREGVESDILTGAQRIRRRRTALTATGGALTALLLVGGGLVVSDMRSGPEQAAAPSPQTLLSLSSSPSTIAPAPQVPPPAVPSSDTATVGGTSDSTAPSTSGRTTRTPTPSATTTPRVESIPQATGPVLGPSGYGKLQLGMTFENAKATGMLTGTDTAPQGCADYKLAEGSAALNDVRISSTYGIVGFDATGARTPEKIKIGSTTDQLEAAYPNASSSGSGYSAASGSGGTYVFGVDGNKVVGLQLVGSGSC
ncbi:hypothetical protein HFP15_11095 [Amycolatopsis sp. K13G38]|uniref:Uncharacterized protein n=1 Tax=Amycolatopsis acididurans TaxID=2724524 RepID=A0ABX1J216_9PSEU|nr:hypothetical protein [Amycolatopsis acididurans]NKQ53426.1 hypothetical protein [Amycolatopsis acididurans]